MSNRTDLLGSVWGLHSNAVLAEAVQAVEANDRAAIEACITKFEAMLAEGGGQPYALKEEGWRTEILSKVAVLKAILSGSDGDWQSAHDAYQHLANAMSALAGSCCSCEDIAQIMFEADRDHAVRLANLCLTQIVGKQKEAARKQFIHDAKALVTRVGPSLGCGDFTYGPDLPEGRDDIAVIRRMAENGHDYGYDTIYVVWKTTNGSLEYRAVANSSATKAYLDVSNVRIEGDTLVFAVSHKGTIRIPLASLR
jgi:hypothetical protein